jgi:DNA recombination protein RmuC
MKTRYGMEIALITMGITLLGLASVVLLLLNRKAATDPSVQMLQDQLLALRKNAEDQSARLLEQVSQLGRSVPETLQKTTLDLSNSLQAAQGSMNQRLENVARVVQQVSGNLGDLNASQKRIFDVGQSIADLQNLLNAPKFRGEFGETLLEEIIRNAFAAHQYQFQHPFRDGQRVDAVLRIGDHLLPIDAKFPMEDFQRMTAAQEPSEQKRLRTALVRNLQKKVDEIAEKYIRTDESTFDFAFMYIPAENVYYELIVRQEPGEQGTPLAAHARSRNVVPVSPNTFLAYLHVVLHGLAGLKLQEETREIQSSLLTLAKLLERLREEFGKGAKHLNDARKNFEDADKMLSRLEDKLDQAKKLSPGDARPNLPSD